jgi:membrane-anchored glycerophosphoryl diester phosphodiesterase (GDPDase)
MNAMDYGWVLKRAWEITWKFKGLWVLGILASCSSGGGGGGGGGGSSGARTQIGPDSDPRFLEIQRWIESIPPETWIVIAIVVAAVILVLGLVFLVLGVIGQGGLIAGFNQVEDSGTVTLAEAFRLGTANFWRLLGVRIVFWLAGVLLAIALVVAAILVAIGTLGIGLLCLVPLLCVLIPVGAIVGVYVTLTQVALVTEHLTVGDAFRRSWQVLKENLGPVIVIGLIVLFGSLIIGLLLALPLIAAVLPVALVLALGGDQATTTGLVMAGLCLVVYLPVMIVANGALQTYVSGVWTLAYRQWTGRAKGSALTPVKAPAAA